MLTTCGTVVRRVGHQEVNRATGAYIAKVVQGALVGCVARGEMPTSGARGLLIVTAIKSQLGCWEVLDVDNALGGVWYVFTRSKHGWLPWKKGWDQSIKVITCPVYIESRIPATVSETLYDNNLDGDNLSSDLRQTFVTNAANLPGKAHYHLMAQGAAISAPAAYASV